MMQVKILQRARNLKRAGVSEGSRFAYWVSYVQNDHYCREYYWSAKQAHDRADELARQAVRVGRGLEP